MTSPIVRASFLPAPRKTALPAPVPAPSTAPEQLEDKGNTFDAKACNAFVKSWQFQQHPLPNEAYAKIGTRFNRFVDELASEGGNFDGCFALFWPTFFDHAGGRTCAEFFHNYLRASRDA
ncbi:hypothetical protein OH76DRAFT_1421449 [Lentinus brumalis]|uniref:Uncharacterized protein n=1 Tax=Lentinus brumalis TaxID=2498619 RepID=A0A371CVP1_9APHY|nr:hypothetical protein OH76DRAFT_1421449 [Polyporus brumalis]